MKLGIVQVLYKHVRGGWGSEGNAYFAYVVRGQNSYIAYVKHQNSYSPENGFQICEISLNSVVKGHI